MDLGGHVALVTGGGSGIGEAIARRLASAGSRVLICGRRADALARVASENPGIETITCDVGDAAARDALVERVLREHPDLDMVVNNAGIQRRFRVDEPEPWSETHQEIAINLDAVIHFSLAFLPHFLERDEATIVNVSSGLAFVPLAMAPVYCATKAAVHSFTMSLRHQLADSSVRVIEILPPAVNTDLGGAGLHTFGAPLEPFADEVMARMAGGEEEIAYGFAQERAKAAQSAFGDVFQRMNAPRPH